MEEDLTRDRVGYYTDPTLTPKVGDVYYCEIAASTVGNAFAGVYAHLEVRLPPNTFFAISPANPVRAYYENFTTGAIVNADSDVTQTPLTGIYGGGFFALDAISGPWPLPLGQTIHVRFPVVSTSEMSGIFSNSYLVGAVRAIDGEGNPWDGPGAGWNGITLPPTGPWQGVFVVSNPPTITYPVPSATNITASAARTTANLAHHYAPGNFYFDIGPTATYGTSSTALAIPNTFDGYNGIYSDWGGLTQGTTYHWRARFVTSAGITYNGADQSFSTTSTSVNISGHTRDGNNAAIPYVRMDLESATRGTSLYSDNNGDFTFFNVAPGTYTLRPFLSGLGFTPTTRTITITNASVANQDFVGSSQVATLYHLGGRVANNSGIALPGVSVTRSGNGLPAVTTTTNSAGYFTFDVVAGTYTLTPVLNGYNFTPVSRSATVVNYDLYGQNFTGTSTTTFKITGRVANGSGIGLANVAVVRSGSATPAITNSAGYYTILAVPLGTWFIAPAAGSTDYRPDGRFITVTSADVNNQNFTALYRVSGRVTTSAGVGLQDVSIALLGSTQSIVTNSAGYYTFGHVANGSYTISPTLSTATLIPQSRNVTVANANISGQDFVVSSGTPGATYSVAGRISTSAGAAVANVQVSRTGSATPVTTNTAGYYTFTGVPNGSYTLTPSLSGKTFSPATKTVTVNGANVGSQNFVGS